MNLHTLLAAGLILGSAGAQTTQQIAARLTANDLKADVSFLASDALQGRGTPSPGLDIAAEFIAAQFRRAGLEPAGDDGYFQTAPFVNVTSKTEGLELTLQAGGQTIQVDKGSLALMDAAALDVKDAPVVRVPFADASAVSALTVEQVRGKVLLLESPQGGGRGGSLASLRRLSVLHPAALLLLLAVPGGPTRPGAALRDASAPSVPAIVLWDAAAKTALAANKEITATIHIPAPSVTEVKLHNVVGILRGSDSALKDTYVLVTGHYDHLGVRGTGPGDHIFNGANDDASGTASVIEIANTLAGLPARPKRSIVFIALFGEEMGLLGSRYYASHPIFPLAKTIADLNLEQMGRTDDNTGPRVGMVNVTGYDYTSITAVLQKAGQDFDIRVVKDEQNSDPFFARSDNQAFADAGVPAHTLSVGYVFPDYHQAGDEWPKIDYENMAKVDRTVALGLWRIADSTEAPQWNQANPKTERYIQARTGK